MVLHLSRGTNSRGGGSVTPALYWKLKIVPCLRSSMGQIFHLKFRFESIKKKKILLFRVVDEIIIATLLFQNTSRILKNSWLCPSCCSYFDVFGIHPCNLLEHSWILLWQKFNTFCAVSIWSLYGCHKLSLALSLLMIPPMLLHGDFSYYSMWCDTDIPNIFQAKLWFKLAYPS